MAEAVFRIVLSLGVYETLEDTIKGDKRQIACILGWKTVSCSWDFFFQ